MKLLYLTFNYPPDLGAGSFRSKSLVDYLVKNSKPDDEIEVITTFPNRYKGYILDTKEKEKKDNLIIHRIKLPNYFQNNLRLIINFFYFAFYAVKISRKKNYNIIFATSSRLLTGVLGALIAYSKNSCYYLDIRDIFLDNIYEIYPKFVSIILSPFISLLERFMLSQANKVNLISEGFKDYFKTKYPRKHYDYFTNGIDEEFNKLSTFKFEKNDKIVKKDQIVNITYAGNIGKGQGLANILPKLSTNLGKNVCFNIIGDGGEKAQLIKEINKNPSSNIKLIEPVRRDELIKYYHNADILFLHLNNFKSFEKVLPSKIFEYGAIGKPIYAGLKGFSKTFLQRELPNSYIFDPCDLDNAIKIYKNIELEIKNNSEFINKYLRSNVSQKMVESIVELNAKK